MQTARELLVEDFFSVSSDATLKEIFTLFLKERPAGILVQDDDGTYYGVVTESDLVEQQASLHLPAMIALLEGVFVFDNPFKLESQVAKMSAVRAEDICSKEVKKISPSTSLQEIASIMTEEKFHFLPVEEDGRIIGVVSKKEVLYAIAKNAGYLD